jgi:hypothetical protein
VDAPTLPDLATWASLKNGVGISQSRNLSHAKSINFRRFDATAQLGGFAANSRKKYRIFILMDARLKPCT